MHPRLDRFRHYQQQPQQQQQQQQQQSPQRVLFVTRRPEPRPAQEPIIVVIDDATLKAFVRCVYIVAAIFILVTSITWLAISWTEFDFYGAVPVPSFAWILLAFFLLMVMNCVPPVRRIFPINWGITICILLQYFMPVVLCVHKYCCLESFVLRASLRIPSLGWYSQYYCFV
ncbi:hypothetical protein ACLKA6_000987 [Drosophila palustris]